MPTTITFRPFIAPPSGPTASTVKSHRVYLKTVWTEDWAEVEHLHCDEAVWAIGPQLSTARLTWDYGFGMRQGEAAANFVAALTGKTRAFVKIEFDPPDIVNGDLSALVWYGTLEVDDNQVEGVQTIADTPRPFGSQQFHCYGLEHLLERTPILKSYWAGSDDAVQTVERPIVFNAPDAIGNAQGNRSDKRLGRSYVFDGRHDVIEQKFWSTRDIVEYLLVRHHPADKSGDPRIPFLPDLTTLAALPDWDKPIVDPRGKTVWGLVNELVHRGRLLGCKIEVVAAGEGETAGESVDLQFFTLIGKDVTTDDGTLTANPNQIVLAFDADPDCQASLKQTVLQSVDQFVFQGARRTSTFSVSNTDGTLVRGWEEGTLGELVVYEKGASEQTGYADLTVDQKQMRNAEVRASAKAYPVFRRFKISEAWECKAGDGVGGSKFPVFPPSEGSADSLQIYPRETYVLPRLPMRDGYDYAQLGSLTMPTDPPKIAEGPHNHLPPIVVLKDPETDRWIAAEDIGHGSALEMTTAERNRRFSCRVEVPAQDRAILVHVHGQPQHAIAYGTFTRLPVDEDLGRWDWRKMIATICVADDRYCEARWPDDQSLSADLPAVRRQVVDAGDKYRLDYLVANTVLGVDKADGTLLRATSTAGAWIRDDRKRLLSRAKLAYEYYKEERRSLEFETARVNNVLKRGQYVVSIGQAQSRTVGSVISQIRVTVPESADAITIHYTTAFGELDALA